MSEELVAKIYKVTDEAIHGFFKEHRFLSNFHICDILYEEYIYTSTEAAFQAAKVFYPNNESKTGLERFKFTNMTPSNAKAAGRTVKLREDWEDVKFDIMYQINLIKFSTHPELKKKLLETGTKYLEESNWWGDKTWGKVNGEGLNLLGDVLMEVRAQLNISRFKEIKNH